MPYFCSGCGDILTPKEDKPKLICISCGVLTDLRTQGFLPAEPTAVLSDRNNKNKPLTAFPSTDTAQDAAQEAQEKVSVSRSIEGRTVPVRKVIPEDYQSSKEDDGLGYGLTDAHDFHCPGCGNVMTSTQIVCIACGYHLEKRNRIRRSHKVLRQSWQEGLNRKSRILLSIASIMALVLVGFAAVETGYSGTSGALVLIFIVSSQAVYLIGTHGKLSLSRNSKGKIMLDRYYWIAFVPVDRKKIAVEGHDGIKLTQTAHAGFIEYTIGVILLIPFVFPAICWYLSVIQGTTFEVALTRDMGRSVDTLFKSRDEFKAREIATLLQKISKLPLNQR